MAISEQHMTRKTNARLAGFAFLFYIATGIASLVMFNQATGGGEEFAKLKSIAQNATTMRLTVLLMLCGFVSAVVLGVTLYALTRDEDRDLALLALCCRVAEGVIAAVAAVGALQLLAVATVSTGAVAADASAAHALGAMLLQQGNWNGKVAATCFVMGSTIFSYLFLRARSVPASLAWLGLLASVLLLVAVPLELGGFIRVTFPMWLPMLVFEVTFALWLIIKGVATPRTVSQGVNP
jgi:hypothetical protein